MGSIERSTTHPPETFPIRHHLRSDLCLLSRARVAGARDDVEASPRLETPELKAILFLNPLEEGKPAIRRAFDTRCCVCRAMPCHHTQHALPYLPR